MSSSDQTDCSQQLQHQRLCPDAMKGGRLDRFRQKKHQYSIHTMTKEKHVSLSFYFKKIKSVKMSNQIEENVSNRNECQVYP